MENKGGECRWEKDGSPVGLFPGKYETDQLAKIFQLLGTPSVADWPDKSPVLRNNFVNFQPRNILDLIPDMDRDPLARDLLGCPPPSP